MKTLLLLTTVLLALQISACGQKGPLYLPKAEDKPAQQKTDNNE